MKCGTIGALEFRPQTASEMAGTYIRYRQARKDARPLMKNWRPEIKLKMQIWMGIQRSGPMLMRQGQHGCHGYQDTGPANRLEMS